MSLLRKIREPVAERVGRAELRLFEAILATAPSETDPGKGTISLDKAQVLDALARAEGKAVSDEVIRSRLKKLRAAFTEIGREGHGVDDGFLTLSARKDRLVLTWSPGAIARLERAETRRVVARTAPLGRDLPVGELVEPRFTLPNYRVFISHGWEGEGVERILDAFSDQLERRLASLPEKYRDRFAVRTWMDRPHMHGRAEFDIQADRACQQSHFAILMTSDKWFASPACQKEYQHFRDKEIKERGRPFIRIQLSGQIADQDSEFQNVPAFPYHWEKNYPTLLSLWEEGNEHNRDQFVGRIRDEICAYLDRFGGSGLDPEPTGRSGGAKPPRLLEVYRDGLLARDIAVPDVVETRFQLNADEADELEETGKSIEALALLEHWVRDPEAQQRVLVILGGFGMGKTVVVQRLADRLLQARSDPTPALLANPLLQARLVPMPIYLDFRRLIPAAKPGEPVRIDLADIIHGAIGRDAAHEINADELVAMIRAEPCVVIFDGLDEIGNRIGRDHAAALYRQLLELVPREAWQADAKKGGRPDWTASPIRIVVTCRTHFFRSFAEEQGTFALADRADRQLRASIRTLHMAPLSLDAIKALFTRSLGPEQGAKAFVTIQAVHDLLGLARRPLMARYISEMAGALVERHQVGAVINIATVYEELFYRALARDGEKAPLLSSRDSVDILKALALRLHQDGASAFDVADLERWFDAFVLDHAGLRLVMQTASIGGRTLLQTELRNASFLVRVRDDNFAFAHTSFYEYFLSLSLLDAVLGGSVDAFDGERLSRETIDFLSAAVRQREVDERVKAALNTLIASDASREVRTLVWRLMCRSAECSVPALPPGANLSGFDLRDLSLPPGTVWDHVRLDGAVLTGLDARRAHFRTVSFDGAWIGDARFDDCRFVQCSGTPNGATSARVWRGTIDAASGRLFETARYCWPSPATPAASTLRIDRRSGPIRSVAFSPDGSTVLTGDSDGTVRLWDAGSGGEIGCLEGHGGLVRSVAFSPDGSTVLTGGDDGMARLWDVDLGAEIDRLEGHRGSVMSVAFSPDGSTVLTGGSDRTARLWDASRGAEIGRLEGHGDWVSSVAFSPDSRTLLTGGGDGTARLWDADSSTEILRLEGHRDWVSSVAFSSDSATVLTGSSDGIARLWDAWSGAELHRLEGHEGWVRSVAFSPDGEMLLTGGDDRTARLWDAGRRAEIRRLTKHELGVSSVAFSSDGATVLTGGPDGIARMWDAGSGVEIRRLGGCGDLVNSVAFSPGSAPLLAMVADGAIRLWDSKSGAEVRYFAGHGGWVTSVAFSPDGATLLTGDADGTARLWDVGRGAEIRCLESHGRPVRSVAFSPDGAKLLTGGDDGTARLWDVGSGAEIRRLEGHWRPVNGVAFSPDGVTLLTAGDDGTARLWDARRGTEIRLLAGHELGVTGVAFSADGATLLTGGTDGTGRLWDAGSGVEIRRMAGHERRLNSVAFSPDGATLLTGGADGTARLWDIGRGAEIRCLESHGRPVTSVAFSPDGATLLIGGSGGAARLCDVATGALIMEILPLPDSWVVFDADGEILRHGPNIWRYAYCLAPTRNGLPQVVAPDEAALTRLQV